MEKKPTRTLELDLLNNGLDFVKEGIEKIYPKHKISSNAYKYALLNIYSGTLLILKEKLKRQHRSLIYAKVEDVDQPSARTVNFDEVVKRLQRIAGINFGDDLDILRRAQKERNIIEHFELKLNVKEVDKLVGEIIEFLDRFLVEHIGTTLKKHLKSSAWLEVKEFVKIAERLRKENISNWCKRVDKFKKLSELEVAELIEGAQFHPKYNPDGGLSPCVYCYEDSVVVIEPDIALCTNPKCKKIVKLEECIRCNEMRATSVDSLCSDCDGYVADQ